MQLPLDLFDKPEKPKRKRLKSDPKARDKANEFLALGKGRRPRKEHKTPPHTQAYEQAKERALETGDWNTATPRIMVGLWAVLYELTYKRMPVDYDAKSFTMGERAARKCIAEHFNNDYDEVAVFMQWSWERQVEREQWKRDNDRQNDFRITINYQFSNKLVEDYRIHQHQANKL